jgi:phage terminase large subunit-like protein
MPSFEINWDEFLKLSPDEQREIHKALMRLDDAASVNPLRFFFPHGPQHKFLSSSARFKWMLGGNQSGKTTVCCVDDIIQAVDADCLPEHLKKYKHFNPPFHARVVGPDFDIVEMVVMEKLKEWLPRYQLVGDTWDKAYDKSHKVLRFKNGSFFQFKTYQQEAWTHGGATLNRVRFDEEPPMDIFNENRMRVMALKGDLLVAMTPVQGLTWMYDKFWTPHERGELKNSFVQTVDMEDNVYIDADVKKETLAGYDEDEREARKTGKFIHFHGRVYDKFTNDHVIPSVDTVPENCPVYVGIDPGVRHMAAVVFFYHTTDDTLVQFHELALQGKTAGEVAKAIHEVNSIYEIRPQWYVIDPSARNKEHITGRNLQMEYSDHGITTFAGQNDVRTGINRVKFRLKPLDRDGNELPAKLLVTANCEETIKEFRMYRWSKPAKTSSEDPMEKPIKKDDHLLDALRYVVMARPFAPHAIQQGKHVDPLTAAMHAEMNGKKRKPYPAHFY